MAMDALEKERLRRKMATAMRVFAGAAESVQCVSAHWYEQSQLCELSQRSDHQDMVVIKNRSGKTMRVSVPYITEMVRFQVIDVEDLSKWLSKIPELKVEAQKRKEAEAQKRDEERKKLEKRVIVRKRPTKPSQSSVKGNN